MDRRALLGTIPPFDALHPEELTRVCSLFREIRLPRGETLCRRGEPGETFYVLVHGELEVWGGHDGKRVINRMGPGEFLGEITLLLGEPRTATVTAGRDARLLALDRKAFETVVLGNAKILAHLTRVMAGRLASVSRGEVPAKESLEVCVTGPQRLKGKTTTAAALAGLLQELTGRPALHVHLRRAAGRLPRGAPALRLSRIVKTPRHTVEASVRARPDGPALLEIEIDPAGTPADRIRSSLGRILEICRQSHPCLVLDVGGGTGPLRTEAAALADLVVRLENGGTDARTPPAGGSASDTLRVLNRYNPGAEAIPIHHMEPFVLPLDPALRGRDPLEAHAYVRRHPRAPFSRPLQRLARKILGCTVGLALGGGAAFGIAHVGVIRVLEENGVPIDLLAGTSMGSIVALGCAAGLSGARMEEIARRVGNRRTTLSALDFTLARPGFLRGDRLVRIFSPLLEGVEDFEQLVLPCRTVAADILSGERVTLASGRLDAAFRASCSVPMVWSPVRHGSRVLVDGAVVDPVPADVVREMGADICIAVNVVPPLHPGVSNVLSRLYRKANRVNPLTRLSGDPGLPSLFDVILNSIQALQYELGAFKGLSADVTINPDLSGHTWIEFYRPAELIEKGAAAAASAVPEIWGVLEEKRARRGPPERARHDRSCPFPADGV